MAEFYRVEAALIRAGIRVGTDRGMSDENEPWFVFYRTDDGEVVIHFARIDGEYLIAGPAYEEIARGFDFTSMVRNMVARHPMIRRTDRGDNIALHPAALLVAVVGTAFFKTGEARAAETGATNAHAHSRPILLSSSSSNSLTGGASAPPVAAANAQPTVYDTVQLPANQAVLILAAAVLAADFRIDNGSLEPAAQEALVSVASSVDFASPVTRDLSLVGVEGSVLDSHASAVANTPVQTVSSVLSLVALLATLPSTPEPAVSVDDSQAALSVALASPELSSPTAYAATPVLQDAANWALQVRLGVGALPNIEAVQLVRALVGDAAAAQKITIIEVSKLPDVLADIISRGEHAQVTNPVQPGGQTGESPAAPVTPDHSASSGSDTQTKAPSHVPFVSMDLVQKFLDYFVAHTEHIVWATGAGSEVVWYDSRVMADPGSIHTITSVNFELPDHSVIHLIGDQSAFLNGGLF